jgi:GT2 family glycosyltransferase
LFHPVKVFDLELSGPPVPLADSARYESLLTLIRLHGDPVGMVSIEANTAGALSSAMQRAALEEHAAGVIRHLLADRLALPEREALRLVDLLEAPHPVPAGSLPLVTVAVCTRDRTHELARCLDSLCELRYPALDLLVVDNAPIADTTARLVRERYPNVRYVCEPRPGLDWARNRAIDEARGEIIAYTDDDVVVDAGWVSALAAVFVESREVMAVTGLVVPYELETEPQALFERYGGFGRGFRRKWYRLDRESGERAAMRYGGAGQFGTGANMAYRRSVFATIGGFDPALDVGTVTNGGGDLEMFFRVLKEGHQLVYEARAVVRHRHRREYAQLRTQLANNGVGFYSYLVRSALVYPDERLGFIRLGLWWFWWWNVRRLLISLVAPSRFPRDLIVAELLGSLIGLGRYRKARQTAAEIAKRFGPPTPGHPAGEGPSRR